MSSYRPRRPSRPSRPLRPVRRPCPVDWSIRRPAPYRYRPNLRPRRVTRLIQRFNWLWSIRRR